MSCGNWPQDCIATGFRQLWGVLVSTRRPSCGTEEKVTLTCTSTPLPWKPCLLFIWFNHEGKIFKMFMNLKCQIWSGFDLERHEVKFNGERAPSQPDVTQLAFFLSLQLSPHRQTTSTIMPVRNKFCLALTSHIFLRNRCETGWSLAWQCLSWTEWLKTRQTAASWTNIPHQFYQPANTVHSSTESMTEYRLGRFSSHWNFFLLGHQMELRISLPG